METVEGSLAVAHLVLEPVGRQAAKNVSARLGSEALPATLRNEAGKRVIDFGREAKILPGRALQVIIEG